MQTKYNNELLLPSGRFGLQECKRLLTLGYPIHRENRGGWYKAERVGGKLRTARYLTENKCIVLNDFEESCLPDKNIYYIKKFITREPFLK